MLYEVVKEQKMIFFQQSTNRLLIHADFPSA